MADRPSPATFLAPQPAAIATATLILETDFETSNGAVRLIDFMTRREGASDVVRIVLGLRGTVAMRMEMAVRFDYGSRVPWVSRVDDGRLQAVAGPERLLLDTEVDLRGEDMRSVGDFTVQEGQRVAFTLNWSPSHHVPPEPLDPDKAETIVEGFWTGWASAHLPCGEWAEAQLRSLLTLKALAHWKTGGIVAAGTTSLPEKLGGPRNWDYRFCWLRDATFTLYALIGSGFLGEAQAWRDWLLRAVAGSPDDLQIMYGVAGEARLTEYEIPWLTGYEGSIPVRVGNAAAGQLQLDVYGEVIEMLYTARKRGPAGWRIQLAAGTRFGAASRHHLASAG